MMKVIATLFVAFSCLVTFSKGDANTTGLLGKPIALDAYGADIAWYHSAVQGTDGFFLAQSFNTGAFGYWQFNGTYLTAQYSDIVIIKYSPKAKLLWYRHVIGDGIDQPNCASYDPVHDILWVAGDSTSTTLSIDGVSAQNTFRNGFVMRIQGATGRVLSIKRFGVSTAYYDQSTVRACAVDTFTGDGSFFMAGQFSTASLTIDEITIQRISGSQNMDVWITKLDRNGYGNATYSSLNLALAGYANDDDVTDMLVSPVDGSFVLSAFIATPYGWIGTPNSNLRFDSPDPGAYMGPGLIMRISPTGQLLWLQMVITTYANGGMNYAYSLALANVTDEANPNKYFVIAVGQTLGQPKVCCGYGSQVAVGTWTGPDSGNNGETVAFAAAHDLSNGQVAWLTGGTEGPNAPHSNTHWNTIVRTMTDSHGTVYVWYQYDCGAGGPDGCYPKWGYHNTPLTLPPAFYNRATWIIKLKPWTGESYSYTAVACCAGGGDWRAPGAYIDENGNMLISINDVSGGSWNVSGVYYQAQMGSAYSIYVLGVEYNDCAGNACPNGATCVDGYESASCVCPSGFTGTLCDVEVNECGSAPCQNGGACSDLVDAFQCTCLAGFSGATCQTDINECSSTPCQNGGRCSDLTDSFQCACVDGFIGDLCQTDVNECASAPCQNGGTCQDFVNRFSCICPPKFSGMLCQTDINECASVPCANGGTCNENSVIPGFTCICPPGWSGALCQTDINECASLPCMNGGSCTESSSSGGLTPGQMTPGYTCHCRAGFFGTNCQTNINECSSNPCGSGQQCVDGVGSYVCVCPAGFDGPSCANNINECNSSPCSHGTCTDGIASYVCSCTPGYSGARCQTNINECASSPCQSSHQDCVDGINSYVCIEHPISSSSTGHASSSSTGLLDDLPAASAFVTRPAWLLPSLGALLLMITYAAL